MTIHTITATITGFSTSEKGLTVYFTQANRKLHALAHPALKVTPHIGKEQTVQIAETEQGWKMIQPYPSKDEIAAWEAAKAQAQAQVAEATKAQLKLLATF